MFKRLLTGAAVALAAALVLSAPARASTHTVGFEDKSAFTCEGGATQHDGGLSFTNGFFACYYSHANPVDYPFVPTSTVMAIGDSDFAISEDDGSVFDLLTFDLSAGPFTLDGDTTSVTGFLHNGGTLTTTLSLSTSAFSHITLNWLDLDSVTFTRPLATRDAYVGFDNIRFNGTGFDTNGGVPEPAVWTMLLLGFATAGLMLRRARQLALAPID